VTSRHITTAITLLVLTGILALGLFVGFRELFAPLPGEDDETTVEPASTCGSQELQVGQRLRSRDVLVNVFNSGDRAGLAGQTMDTLSRRGFRPGEIDNTTSGGRVQRVQVWIVEGEEAAGRLVARNFGPKVKVRTRDAEDDLGVGVDVVVSNGLRRVGPPVRAVRVREAEGACVAAG
jgi:LytR cell envelope-related transcriptional attenuator